MKSMLFHIKTTYDENDHLQDDRVVRECMDRLTDKYPQIISYQWERVEGGINLLMWHEHG